MIKAVILYWEKFVQQKQSSTQVLLSKIWEHIH